MSKTLITAFIFQIIGIGLYIWGIVTEAPNNMAAGVLFFASGVQWSVTHYGNRQREQNERIQMLSLEVSALRAIVRGRHGL